MSSLIPCTLSIELAPNTYQYLSEVVLQFAVTSPRSGPTSHFLDEGPLKKFSTNTKFIHLDSFKDNKVEVVFRCVPQNPNLIFKVLGISKSTKEFNFSLDPKNASTFKISHVLHITESPYLCALRTRRHSEYVFDVVQSTQV